MLLALVCIGSWLPLAIDARRQTQPLEATGDALLDEYMRVMVQKWRRGSPDNDNWQLDRREVEALRERFPDDPRVNDLYLPAIRMETGYEKADAERIRFIRKCQSEGTSTPAMDYQLLVATLRQWRSDAEKATGLNRPQRSRSTPQQLVDYYKGIDKWIGEHHGSEREAALAAVQSGPVSYAAAFYFEAARLADLGEYEAAMDKLREGNRQPDARPQAFPYSAFVKLYAAGRVPKDKVAAAAIEQNRGAPLGISIARLTDRLAEEAARRRDFGALQDLHVMCCRLAGEDGRVGVWMQCMLAMLKLERNHLPLALPASSTNLQVVALDKLLDQESTERQALMQSSNSHGFGAAPVSKDPLERLITLYKDHALGYLTNLNNYDNEMTWRAAAAPSGKLGILLKQITAFDYRELEPEAPCAAHIAPDHSPPLP
ncbi:hypothetical protein IT575_15330 [bacterium]|nr:hypothetical protein [bacterium]